MKSILVIDTPTTCAGCPCYDYIHGVCAITYKDCELRKRAKPEWCPLKPLPQKKNTSKIQGFGYSQIMWTNKIIHQNEGWNDCLEEITK